MEKALSATLHPRRALLWLWFPLAAFILFTAMEVLAPSNIYAIFVGENGPLEIAQVLVISFACFMSVLAIFQTRHLKAPLERSLFFLCALGAFYIAGEEVSWGQHIFFWDTPESWQAINDQQDTNLHNTSSWLDQKPRLILEIGVIIGGLILPLLLKYKAALIPVWLKQVAPPAKMWLCALCFLIIKIFDKIGDASDFVFYKRASEMTELYIYYFVLLYILYLVQRLKSTQSPS
jgi:hypothetical protein